MRAPWLIVTARNLLLAERRSEPGGSTNAIDVGFLTGRGSAVPDTGRYVLRDAARLGSEPTD